MNSLYNKYIKIILSGCELVINYEKYESYLYYKDKTKNIDYDISLDLMKDDRIELDSGNDEYCELCYRRTENWKDDLNNLKITHPQLFRKNKIIKILKNG